MALGACAAPCLFCFWAFFWQDIRADLSLRLYPGVQEVGDAYGYYGAGSGLKFRYYWTADSVKVVQAYYEKFTYPFIEESRSGGLITVFSLDGSELRYRTVDSVTHVLNFPTEAYCQYTQRYSCANVRLIQIESPLLSLPTFISGPS